MLKFIVNHVIQLLVVMLTVATLTFVLIRLAPGDPAMIMLKANGIGTTDTAVEELQQQLGLSASLGQQYVQWLGQVFTGNWGISFTSQQPVVQELLARLPATIELAVAGLAVMLIVTLTFGISATLYERRFIDHFSQSLALLSAAIPNFWLGFLFIYAFSVHLEWFPSMGRGSIQQLILPALTLGLSLGFIYARILREQLVSLWSQPFVKSAQARGFSKRQLLINPLLKHAFLPILTMVGTNFAFMLGGSTIVETIFSWPGLGQYIVQAITMRDYPVIQGYVLFTAALFVIIHTLIDALYIVVDPRLRRRRE